jgi:hypothetical protein
MDLANRFQHKARHGHGHRDVWCRVSHHDVPDLGLAEYVTIVPVLRRTIPALALVC